MRVITHYGLIALFVMLSTSLEGPNNGNKSAQVYPKHLSTLYPNFGSVEGGVQHNEPGNRTIRLYHSHLAIEVYNFKFWRSPWCSEGRTWGTIHA